MTGTSFYRHAAVGAAVSLALLAVVGEVVAQDGHDKVTYADDVAPILQEKCQVCHQPNSIAPMSLLTYDEARAHAGLIRLRVSERSMPPWHIDRTVGIQHFQNDRGLTDEQIETIVSWVDGGMERGDPANEPPPKQFPDPNRWQLADRFGEPDLIIKSEPFTLEAETQDKWFRPVVETGLTEARWVRAIEIKPSYPDGRKIIHHVLTYLLQEEDGLTNLASTAQESQRSAGLFMEWAVGKVGEIFPEGSGKLMLPGSRIGWEVHMHAMGERIVDNQAELAVYFWPKDYVPDNRVVLRMFDARGQNGLDIPPGQISVTQQFHTLPAPARLENFQPHMHMRGKAMSLEVIYPDGTQEMLSRVDNFHWNWHINYVYAEDAAPLLPKGTVLIVTAWHDNTADNPSNPDPDQWVGWGDRTVDEMAHLWVDVTYLEQEQFDRLVAERKAMEETEQSSGSR